MAKGQGLRALLAVAGVALGFAAAEPARAQYFSPGYPAVIAVPPPAQGMVIPKRTRPQPPPPPPTQAPPTVDEPAPNHTCSYHGRTMVCE
jgi:hypothetical protein